LTTERRSIRGQRYLGAGLVEAGELYCTKPKPCKADNSRLHAELMPHRRDTEPWRDAICIVLMCVTFDVHVELLTLGGKEIGYLFLEALVHSKLASQDAGSISIYLVRVYLVLFSIPFSDHKMACQLFPISSNSKFYMSFFFDSSSVGESPTLFTCHLQCIYI
jgi:hypothetical protein